MRFESERCRWLPRALGLLVAVGFPLASPAALAADRVALVVGNSAYTAIGALPNPGNDATDVAAALGRLGFDVTTVRDADRVGHERGAPGLSRGRAPERTCRWCSTPGTGSRWTA